MYILTYTNANQLNMTWVCLKRVDIPTQLFHGGTEDKP